MKHSKLLKVLLSFILLVNLPVLASCKSKTESKSDETQDTGVLENDGEIEIEVAEDEETFGE